MATQRDNVAAADKPPKKEKAAQPEFVALIDEALALVPGTDVEISMLRRYGNDDWKERMIAVREKLTQVRDRALQSEA